MEAKKKRNQFLSGFSNENIIEEFYVSDNKKLQPSTILSENEDRYKIELGIPYMRKDDIVLELGNNQLIISAHKPKSGSSDNKSRSYKGVFEISNDIRTEKIKADYKNDLLTVILPKQKIISKTQESTIK